MPSQPTSLRMRQDFAKSIRSKSSLHTESLNGAVGMAEASLAIALMTVRSQ